MPQLPCPQQYREKAKELWEWLRQLEAEKFELQYTHTKQKYEVRWREMTKNHANGLCAFKHGCQV